MTSSDIDKSQIMYARLAGFVYLFVIVTFILTDFILLGLKEPGNFAGCLSTHCKTRPMICLSSIINDPMIQ